MDDGIYDIEVEWLHPGRSLPDAPELHLVPHGLSAQLYSRLLTQAG
jgi:hypothetical protein